MKSEIFREQAFIPWVQQFPFKETERWGQALRDKIPKTLEGILKGVQDNETFRKTIAKPLIVAVRRMLGHGFVSRQGLPKKLIMEIMKAKLSGEDAAKNYIDSVNLAYQSFDQGELNSAMIAYHLGNSFGPSRFRDAIENALGWLTPSIQPAKQGRFRLKLNNQVKRSGKLITDLAYGPDIIKQENDKINRLINEHLRKGIIRFETGGKSHCDFVLIPDSIVLFDSAKVKEIKYETYKRFISEKHANKLRAVWKVIDKSKRPDPNEYIGHPEKPTYFDMSLDIQVSKKG
jgi:hypothetical protein